MPTSKFRYPFHVLNEPLTCELDLALDKTILYWYDEVINLDPCVGGKIYSQKFITQDQ